MFSGNNGSVCTYASLTVLASLLQLGIKIKRNQVFKSGFQSLDDKLKSYLEIEHRFSS
jgi:hypothetical protein